MSTAAAAVTTTTSNDNKEEDISIVLINGRFVNNCNEEVISIFDTSFHRGDGVFEVMRIVLREEDEEEEEEEESLPPPTTTAPATTTTTTMIRSLDLHLERLQTSSGAVNCPLPPIETLKDWIQKVVEKVTAVYPPGTGSLRLIATKGNPAHDVEPSIIISHSKMPKWPTVFSLWPVLAPWHPAGYFEGWTTPIKWTSYGPNVVSTQKAKSKGYEDALLVSPHRIPSNTKWKDEDMETLLKCHVLDGPNFSIGFIVTSAKDKRPSLHLPCNTTLGLLPSITQSRVAEIALQQGLAVEHGVYTLEYLVENAVEVVVMSTTRGIIPVTQIGPYRIGNEANDNTQTSTWATKLKEILDIST
jgi:branched-subunit amino acid aminotransferase/4-amino-4-deoxychorismate lyase